MKTRPVKPSQLHRNKLKRCRVPVGVVLPNGSCHRKLKTVGPRAAEKLHHESAQAFKDHIAGLSKERCQQYLALREGDVPEYMDQGADDEPMGVEDMLQGNIEVNISHAGGEFQEELRQGMGGKNGAPPRGENGRDALSSPDSALDDPDVDGVYSIKVVDMFSTYIVHAPLHKSDKFVVSSLVGQGLFPCAPFAPKIAVATRVLEMFRVNRLRCPSLSIQSWVKSLCDLHGRPYIPYLAQQFTISFDLYLEVLGNIDKRVATALGRDAPDWRLKNCCPSCTYKLEGEQKLIFSMLVAMDGNDSLKRVLRKDSTFDDDGNPTRGKSQRQDPREADAGGSYFLKRDEVDKWAKEMIDGMVDVPIIDDPDKSDCHERWKNLKEDMTSRMWGVFDETGVFLALCRHGFVLLLADMVRSGELAKYPLAVVEALLDAFGPDVGDGYDIGCGFGKTLKKSPLGKRAEELNFRTLVGSFHGHAHNRLCQLSFLATYVPGMGLEDLEGCERFFSKSNALARSTRYASVFHRRQAIATYLAHSDVYDAYANLSTFLVNNYKQAVAILDQNPALVRSMKEMGIKDKQEFHARLKEERDYLIALSKEPEEETNQMLYVTRLTTLMQKEERLKSVKKPDSRSTRVTMRHAEEGVSRALADVEEIERQMEIKDRWTWGSKEWVAASTLVDTKRYRTCINDLEALVLKRMFELTKMNMSGTGYKLHKHIAKALQTRSKAIRNALARYNSAAAALSPPRRQLTWAEVIDYTFLSEWDLLRDPDANAKIRPWASPAARLVLDTYFKIERAQEEIDCLNVEIRRLVTYIRDEKEYLDHKAREIEKTDPNLAFLSDNISGGVDGTLVPGQRITPTPSTRPPPMEGVEEERGMDEPEGDFVEEDDDEGWESEEVEDEEVAEMLETVLTVATDGAELGSRDE
ncbi:hypothetical protein MSAN_02380000 [Mycena sanguinolenta]|uniref:CxC1-like cysteine cluster associated with KDZ transposases domain-containing protein n=1 Tax=Mycena sanguinolenta TaxID=230812 RepID=A0A8H6X5F2_9AGAR|nr:hypothetical protein MSAN_02380000 [Mycena sanguinolenta]